MLGGTALYIAIHAYVEYIALHGKSRIVLATDDDSRYILQELIPGFSGAHLGGGTDPTIGWRARNAARAAWIALNLQRGGIASGLNGVHVNVAVPDKAWLEAEKYLLYALDHIELQSSVEDGGLSCKETRWELTMRLAEVRNKMAGDRGLGLAKRDYETILSEMRKEPLLQDCNGLARILDIERRLAEVEIRISRESLAPMALKEAVDYNGQHALNRLLAAMGEAVNACRNHNEDREALLATECVPEQQKSKGLFWFRRQPHHEPRITPPANATIDVQAVLAALPMTTQNTPPPIIRTLISILVSLSASLATVGDLANSLNVALASLRFIDHSVGLNFQVQTEGDELHTAWIAVRQGLLCTYAAELTHALQTPGCSPEDFLQKSLNASRMAIALSPKYSALQALTEQHPLANFANLVTQAAYTSAILSAQTYGLLYETSRNNDRLALEKYETALDFLMASSAGNGQEQAGMKYDVLEAIRRCRERLKSTES